MSVGNWRSHIIVTCASCKKKMSYHKDTDTAICNTCKRKEVLDG